MNLKGEKLFLEFLQRDSALLNRLHILVEVQTWIFLITSVWLYELLGIIYVYLRLRTGSLGGTVLAL